MLNPFIARNTTPVFLQSESSECGLASLAMVAFYHGCRTDLASLRLRFSISRKGATLDSLIRVARALKLNSRPLRLDMGNLPELKLPCILHWDMDHFVVLTSLSRRGAVIHDPAVGQRTFSLAEMSKHFTGVALELSPAADFVPSTEGLHFTLRSLMGPIIGLKRGMSQVLLLGLALEVLAIALPFYLQWVLDHALLAADRDLLTTLALGFGLLVLMQTAIGALRSYFIAGLGTDLNFQWLGNVFAHLLKLPLDYFEKRHIGSTLSRFSSISTIQRAMTAGIVQAVADGIMVIGTFLMMLLYSPVLAGLATSAVLLYGLMRWSLFHRLRTASVEQIIHISRQSTHFFETISGIQSVRLFDKGEQRRSGWLNMLADQFNAELRIQHLQIGHETAKTLLFGLERVALVWLAARAVLDHSFTAGMLFAFIAYRDQFSSRLTALIDRLVEFKMLKLHGERVSDIVLSKQEDDGGLDVEHQEMAGRASDIELRGVAFRYSPTEAYVFENINLRIAAGECVAVTGPSGCGKTTLIKVMLGLLLPSKGEVLVGGVPIHGIGLTAYRQMIATVMQEDRLFSGSIADNISFFDPLPDWDRIRASAAQAAVALEIEHMPMAYHTITGDSGVGISGGQKQRILLARALYRQPRILVLDEATSELDVRNEKKVNAAIKDMGWTRIIVAHRPDTIAMADRVLNMEKGRLSEAALSEGEAA